jgi:hypothetical protein
MKKCRKIEIVIQETGASFADTCPTNIGQGLFAG